MKSILILIFSATACVSAAPGCSQEKYNVCDEYIDMEFPLRTSQDMDEYCRQNFRTFNCKIDLATKCPNAPFTKFIEYVHLMKRNMEKVCDEGNSIRRKYIEYGGCYYGALRRIIRSCKISDVLQNYDDEVRCRERRQFYQCMGDIISKNCGQDALDVYNAFESPEYILKEEGCA